MTSLHVITWNLFHGRDAPPNPDLYTWHSRLLRRTETDTTHAQVNRDLLPEFSQMLSHAATGSVGAEWEVALLQECPPRWAEPLARATGAQPHRALTSRNCLGSARALVARHNPDLIASNEGGSNLTLIRPGAGRITMRRQLELRPGPSLRPSRLRARSGARRQAGPERRVMAYTETDRGLCVANLHATNDRPELARDELRRAAETACAWAADRPLILGGDFNLRPAQEDPEGDGAAGIFNQLERAYGLRVPTGPRAIDHLLVRGLELRSAPKPWPATEREPADQGTGLALRLSDHTPVGATYRQH